MKFNWIAAAILTAGLALVPAVAGAAPQDFELHNSTGYEIKSVFVSPHSSNDWQEDVLGEDTLADDASVKIHFPGGRSKTCHWDLKVVYTDDDSSAEWTNGFDLCSISSIDIKWDGKTTSATSE